MIDFDNLRKMVEEKYISIQKHPTADLFIYNYTQKAQFDRVWNNETLQCRGLILDGKNNIVARPFRKFFNLDEAITNGQQLPVEDFEVTEKMDGSLGILYWIGDKPYLATRGSFVSDQAIKGTNILQNYSQYFEELNRSYSYLFEILYPENRIVVDYQGREDIVLLAVVDTQTGKDLDVYKECSGFPFVGRLDGITDCTQLKANQEANKEGFVIRFLSGQRYKVKFDEYVRLHRLVTGVNARTIWDLLRNSQPFDELMERVPDEFYEWVKKTKEDLLQQFKDIEFTAKNQYRDFPTRKESAFYFKSCSYPAIMFKMLDKKDYAELIWKMLKPTAEKPFKNEI